MRFLISFILTLLLAVPVISQESGPANTVMRVPAAGGKPRLGAIDLSASAATTNQLPVAKGGTGASSFTAGSLLFSNGTVFSQDNSNLFWDNTSKYLGIGTTTNLGKLSVGASGNTQVSIVDTSNSDRGLKLNAKLSAGLGFIGTNSSVIELALGIDGTEKARIDSSGNFLVKGNVFRHYYQGGSSLGEFAVRSDGQLQIYAYNGSYKDILLSRDGNSNGGKVLVGKAATGFSSTGVELSPDGVTYITSSSDPLSINKQTSTGNLIYFAYNQNEVGKITTNGTNTTYSTTSDYRLKQNIRPMTGALDKVSRLKPVTYTWKLDGSPGQGFIAHELQDVIPDAVTGKKDAVDKNGKPIYQGIDQSKVVATLTAAIQELKAEVDTLKAEVKILKSKSHTH
jgi:hypothetical protein